MSSPLARRVKGELKASGGVTASPLGNGARSSSKNRKSETGTSTSVETKGKKLGQPARPQGKKKLKALSGGKKLWRKAGIMMKLVNAFKQTRDTCCVGSMEELVDLFATKNKYHGSPPQAFIHSFAQSLRQLVPSFLEQVTNEVIQHLSPGLQLRCYDVDEYLMRVGDPPDGWYFIVSGSCSVFASTKDAETYVKNFLGVDATEKRLGTIKCGSGFGEMAFLASEAKRSATILAAQHGAVCIFVSKEDYKKHLLRFAKKFGEVIKTQKLLKSCIVFKWLPQQTQIQLAHSLTSKILEPFEVYKHESTLLDEVFIVKSGHVQLLKRVGMRSVNLAVLGRCDVGGITDMMVARAFGRREAHCRCTYKAEGQGATLLVLKRYSFNRIVVGAVGDMIDDIARIRIVFEGMRARHCIRHPETAMKITQDLMQTYGFSEGPATDMVYKHRRTLDEKDAKQKLFAVAKIARRSFREGKQNLEKRNKMAAGVLQDGQTTLDAKKEITKKISENFNTAREYFLSAVDYADAAKLSDAAKISAALENACIAHLNTEKFQNILNRAKHLEQKALASFWQLRSREDRRYRQESDVHGDASLNTNQFVALQQGLLKKTTAMWDASYIAWLKALTFCNTHNIAENFRSECQERLKYVSDMSRTLRARGNKTGNPSFSPLQQNDSTELSSFGRYLHNTSTAASNDESSNGKFEPPLTPELELSLEEIARDLTATNSVQSASQNNTESVLPQLSYAEIQPSADDDYLGTNPVDSSNWFVQTSPLTRSAVSAVPTPPKYVSRSATKRSVRPEYSRAVQLKNLPLPDKDVDMHILAVDKNTKMSLLLRHLLVEVARKRLKVSCMVDYVPSLTGRNAVSRNAGSSTEQFSFIVMNLTFPPVRESSTSKNNETMVRKRRRAMTEQIRHLVNFFPPSTKVVLTSEDSSALGLMRDFIRDSSTQKAYFHFLAVLPKPYTMKCVLKLTAMKDLSKSCD